MYQRVSLSSLPPVLDKGKGIAMTKASYLELFNDFRDEALLDLILGLMVQIHPPQESFPIKNQIPPSPTNVAPWWTLCNFLTGNDAPLYMNFENLTKVNKVALLSSIMKHATPRVIRQITSNDQLGYFNEYMSLRERQILTVILDMEEEHLKRSMTYSLIHPKSFDGGRSITSRVNYRALAQRALEEERVSLLASLKCSTFNANSSMNSSGLLVHQSSREMFPASFINSNRSNNIMLKVPVSVEGESSKNKEALTFEQHFSFETEMFQVVASCVSEDQGTGMPFGASGFPGNQNTEEIDWDSLLERTAMDVEDFLSDFEKESNGFDWNEDQAKIHQESDCQINLVGDSEWDYIDELYDSFPELDEHVMNPAVEETLKELTTLIQYHVRRSQLRGPGTVKKSRVFGA